MKITVAPLRNPNKGLDTHSIGDLVSCEAYPSVPYMVVETEDFSKILLNLETGIQASPAWVDGQVWFAREAELIVK